MDTVIGIKYNGGVVLATDQSNAFSIIVYDTNLDKIRELTTHSAMGVAGPNADLVNFSEYVARYLKLYELNNEVKLSIRAQANFCRNELAQALRKGPYQVNLLLGGYDDKEGASLFYIDHYAALNKVNYGVHGYAQYFCLTILDREYKEDSCTEDEAIQLVKSCIAQVQKRFLLSIPNFMIKVLDKDGIRVISFGKDPKET